MLREEMLDLLKAVREELKELFYQAEIHVNGIGPDEMLMARIEHAIQLIENLA